METEALSLMPTSLRESLTRRREIASRLANDLANDVGRTPEQIAENQRCGADAEGIIHWFNTWVWTYDPRLTVKGKSPWIPFDLFPKQEEMIGWIYDRYEAQEEGLCEKSRDVGATWVFVGFAINRWLYVPGFKATFGSRVEDLVDKIGDPDSIFQKARFLMKRLPRWMLPLGFSPDLHDNYMKLINPENDSMVSGAVGENMGRGGRSGMSVIDEGAFLPRAEVVEAAMVGNADCRFWVSSINGHGNLFARKRHSGALRSDQVFRIHWRDDPRKGMAWAIKKKTELSATPHIWASEYDIDYSASTEGLCIPAAWVDASIRISQLLPADFKAGGAANGGLDVGGGGKGRSVFIARTGPIVHAPVSWGNPDTTDTALRGIEEARRLGCSTLKYDNVAIGAGVTSTMSKTEVPGMKITGINSSSAPSEMLWPDGRISKEMFANLRAEGWWMMRQRFQAAFELYNYLTGSTTEVGINHPVDEIIIIPDHPDLRMELSLPKAGKNDKGKILIESKDQLRSRGIRSPDFADALMLTYAPDPSFDQAGFYEMIVSTLARIKAGEKQTKAGTEEGAPA